MNSFISHTSNHRLILVVWFILFFSMIMYLYNSLIIRSDISFFLPQNASEVDSIMRHQLTQGEAGKMILIALEAKNNSLSSQQLADINKQLTKRLSQNNNFLLVQNGQMNQSKLVIEPYYHYRYLLNPLTDSQVSDPLIESFSAQNLSKSFEHLLQRLQFLISPMEQKLFSEDPQMLWLSLLKQWQTQQLEKHHGVWFDPSVKKTLLFVKTRAQGFELEKQEKNLIFINEQINTIINSVSDKTHSDKAISNKTVSHKKSAQIETILTGAPIFALASKKAISQQSKIISALASLTLMTFLYWFFRSVKIVLLIALPLALAILTGMTLVLLVDGFIHGITIAFGITIIGIAVDYPIHLYSHALFFKTHSAISTESEHPPLTAAIQSIWPMIRLGLLTTLIGFSAITLSDFSGLRQLGLFAISGLLSAALTTRFLLPLLPASGKEAKTIPPDSYKFLVKLLRYPLPIFFRLLSIMLPLLALISIYFHQSALWEKDLSALSPVPQWQKKQDFELRKAMGLPELRYTFILQNKSLEALLQQSEQLMPQLDSLKKQGIISGYDMAARYLPSRKYQKAQQYKLPEVDKLQKTLEQVLDQTALDSSAFSPFIDSIRSSKTMPVLSAEELFSSDAENNLISDKIKTLIFQQESSSLWTAIVPLQGVQSSNLNLKALKTVNNNLKLLDLKTQSEKMLAGYRNDALLWFFSGLILILGVLLISSKKLYALIPLALPFSGAVILTIASLLLMGYSLSIFHLVTLLLVVGLGIDYSIFTFFSPKNSEKIKQASEVAQVSVIICMVSTIIMFGALSLSDLPVLKAIGLTASLGAAYAFLLTYSSFKFGERL